MSENEERPSDEELIHEVMHTHLGPEQDKSIYQQCGEWQARAYTLAMRLHDLKASSLPTEQIPSIPVTKLRELLAIHTPWNWGYDDFKCELEELMREAEER